MIFVFGILTAVCNTIFFQPLSTAAAKELNHSVFDNGKTSYRIAVAANASESERWAAAQLADILKQISDADFPIINDANRPTTPEIVIGCNAHTQQLLADTIQPMTDDNEGFVIRSKGPNILIWGGKKRGTMYGVFTFLERELGCRWYSSKVSMIPRHSKYEFSKLEYSEHPAVRFRAVDYFDIYNAQIGVASKINSQRFIRSEQPGGLERFWFEHSFEVFMPPTEFFDTHPEYFSLRDGKRLKDRSQLCLTNPGVLKITIERLRGFIKAHPEYRVYNVAQNDNKRPCLCENCQAIVKKEGGESGLMLWFVNQTAEAMEKEFPDKYIGTFAYQYTRKPPQHIRPRDNVVVILCSIECDFSHPFSHPHNKAFLDDLKNWTAVTPNIFIWDYVVNYRHYLLPHPNFNVLQENIKILKDHNVIGVLEQANTQCRGSEFAELRAYVLSRLLWNPDCSQRKVVKDFINGYYGRSGKYILQYFDLVQGLVDENSYLTYAADYNDPIFNKPFLEKANSLFEKAKAVADNNDILRRVELARVPIVYMNLLTNGKIAIQNGDLEWLETIATKEDIVFSSEGDTTSEFVEYIRKNTGKAE
jgi:hypothetical protein